MGYKLDGLPSDLLASDKINKMSLRVSQDVGTPTASTFSYNEDGTIKDVTTVDSNTGKTIKAAFTYDTNGRVQSIQKTEI